jgi:hypothetical protein
MKVKEIKYYIFFKFEKLYNLMFLIYKNYFDDDLNHLFLYLFHFFMWILKLNLNSVLNDN